MKKILFTLLLLLSATIGWAGDGEGTKEKPYTGDWKASELKEGNYLAYDCIITGRLTSSGITVYDDKLYNRRVISGWTSWGVGYAISEEKPLTELYNDYYSLNSPEVRKTQSFIITKIEIRAEDAYITGHYSGHYDRGNGSMENPYWGEWQASELRPMLKDGTCLAFDCVIKNGGITVVDSKLNTVVANNWVNWSPGNLIDKPEDGGDYELYGKDNLPADRKSHSFIICDVNPSSEDEKVFTITGYFSGIYTAWHEADEFIKVTTADALKYVIQKDNAAKVRLGADIYIGDMGKICDTFSGTISGIYDRVDSETGETKKGMHKLKGKRTKNSGGKDASSRLFDMADHATFEGFILSHIRVEADDEDLGIIAKRSKLSTFRSIVCDSCSIFNNKDFVGVLVGSATGSTFENVIMQSCDVTTDGSSAGSVVGASNFCKFTRIGCGTAAYVFADGGGVNAYSGGITGYSMSDTFTNCTHLGLVGGNDNNVGGIAGYSHMSNFYSCTNYAIVATCDEEAYVKMQKDRVKLLDKLEAPNVEDILTSSGVAGTAGLAVAVPVAKVLLQTALEPIDEMMFADVILDTSSESSVITELPELATNGFTVGPVVGYIVIVALVAATAWYLHYVATGDDYAGGIVGYAYNGTIEQCANFGFVNGIDMFVGGIVGDAKTMVINNCLEAGIVNQERDNHWIDGPYRLGGIAGRGWEGTKITNCLTTNGYHITGASGDNDRLDQTSGNNFCVGSADHDPKKEFLEMYVSQEMVDRGLVATWLNNGAENRAQGIKPWKQKLRAMYYKDWQDTPIPNFGDEVSLANITSRDLISTPEQLIAFRDKVNNGDPFAVACLINDIDMKGADWEPIGTYDHPFRGIFDGRGFTINNFNVSKSGSGKQGAGLFGVIDVFANINNVTIGKDSEITSDVSNDGDINGAAGVVGMFHVDKRRWWGNTFIHNCGSYANVTATKHAAGILGRLYAEDNESFNKVSPYIKLYVDSCFNAGTITASNGNSALLCGYTKNHAVVSKCWSAGHLVSTGSGDAYDSSNTNGEAEYFVGYEKDIDIKDCIAAVDLTNVSQEGVTLFSDDVAYTGKLTYMLNGNDNNPANKLRWKQELGNDAAPVSCRIHIGAPGEWVLDNKGVSYSRDISSAVKPYGTLCLPYSIKAPRNIELFTFNEVADEDGVISLCFTAADEVPAGTPMLYRAGVNSTYEFDDIMTEYRFTTPKKFEEGKWNFNGTYNEKVFEGDGAEYIYYVSNQPGSDGKPAGVIKNATKTTVAPFRAYFNGPSIQELTGNGSTPARVRIVIDGIEDETTALELVNNELVPMQQSAKTYTLFGTEAGKGYRGLMIREGKKVIL